MKQTELEEKNITETEITDNQTVLPDTQDPVISYSEVKNLQKSRGVRIKEYIEDLYSVIVNHPIASAAFACLMAMSVTTSKTVTLSMIAVPIALILMIGFSAGAYFLFSQAKNERRMGIHTIVFSVIMAAAYLALILMNGTIADIVINGGLCVCLSIGFYLYAMGRISDKALILLIIAAGFFIRLGYITAMPITAAQHDVTNWGDPDGHNGYIEYLIKNKHLPDFDVRTVYQFYHTPLHHVIAAVWISCQTAMGIGYRNAFENVQLLTLFYSTICLILCYEMFKLLGLKGKGLAAATAVISFCPTFIIMSGSINNDILSYAFMMGALVNALRWYKDQRWRYMIRIALCIGLGMMTKLSLWMAAPAIAVIFIYIFFKHFDKAKHYIKQFAVFLIICVPMSLWWSVRNYIMFKVPIGYVLQLPLTSKQYIGKVPVMQRLFDFSLYQFRDVADQFMFYQGVYNEFNPLVALMKTSAFDEGIKADRYPDMAGFDKFLFWTLCITAFIGFVSMLWYLFRKCSELNVVTKLFLAVLYLTSIVSYYVFCFKYPHVCTQNIRYALMVIVVGAYFIGLLVKHLFEAGENKTLYKCSALAVSFIVILFCVFSTIVFDIVIMSRASM